MYYSQDWIIRQIEMMTQLIIKFLRGENLYEYIYESGTDLNGDAELLCPGITALIAEGKLCEAEDLLFDNIQPGNPEYLNIAVNFYRSLNEMDDAELLARNFPREEIAGGLRDIMRLFGLPEILINVDNNLI